jgi:hypothetical protein
VTIRFAWLDVTSRMHANPGPNKLLFGAMVALLAACTGSSPSDDRSAVTPSASPSVAASPTAGPAGSSGPELDTHPFEFGTEEFVVEPRDLPYAYTTPTPAPEPTPIDGTYLRILTLDDVGGLLPFRCLRCPPYFPNAGVSTLVLHEGNYWLNHQLSDFRAMGMFTIDGGRITLFNDPWCPRDRGVYRWSSRGGALTFEAVSGTCDYEEARANDLSLVSWTRIKPCVFRIEHLWPGPIAC